MSFVTEVKTRKITFFVGSDCRYLMTENQRKGGLLRDNAASVYTKVPYRGRGAGPVGGGRLWSWWVLSWWNTPQKLVTVQIARS